MQHIHSSSLLAQKCQFCCLPTIALIKYFNIFSHTQKMEILLNSLAANQQNYSFLESANIQQQEITIANDGIMDVDECLLAHSSIPSSSSSSNSSIDCCVTQNVSSINGNNQFGQNEQNGGGNSWSRNAGRKKSHPVWTFFKDLRDSNGVGGVCCLHCDWAGDDRSPNNLRTHLKRFHEVDGIFRQFTQELAMRLLALLGAIGEESHSKQPPDRPPRSPYPSSSVAGRWTTTFLGGPDFGGPPFLDEPLPSSLPFHLLLFLLNPPEQPISNAPVICIFPP